MLESGLRGGMCQVCHKHVKANNKYLNGYCDDVVSSNIAYLDANNLYGGAMSQKLAFKGFEWCDDIQTSEHVIHYDDNDDGDDEEFCVDDNDAIGYI